MTALPWQYDDGGRRAAGFRGTDTRDCVARALAIAMRRDLAAGEVPDNCIAAVSKHYVAIVGGVMRDTHDPSRDGTRCVYGYWHKATP